MNLHTGYILLDLAVRFGWIVLLAWFAWDMKSILVASQRKNQLSIEGKWADLERHFERAAKTRRPFVWLHRRFLMPGSNTAQHALFLHNQGRLEEALAKADLAIKQIARKPKFFRAIHREATFKTLCGSLRARVLILTGLGRYDEARKAAAQLDQIMGNQGVPNAGLAILEMHCGRLDEALAIAEAVQPQDSQYDSMRGLASRIYNLKGEHDKALQALDFETSDGRKFYSSEAFRALNATHTGAKLNQLRQKKLAGVFRPARLIRMAMVYFSKEEFETVIAVLDEAEKTLGPEPSIQLSYLHYRACSYAGLGRAAEAEDYISRMRAMMPQFQKRSLRREVHFATGQSYFLLGRFDEALAEFSEAEKNVIHPLEKHVTTYWIARTHEATSHRRDAISYYRVVADDPIPTWMRKQAQETLARLKG